MRGTIANSEVGEVGAPLGELLAMAGPGCGHHHHPGAAEVGAPAQIDVVAVELDRRVETTDRAEQVGAHQQARRRHGERVADRVVLLLIDLARLDDGVDLAEAVDAEPHVLQHRWVGPRDQLGADDARIRAVQLLHQQPNRSRVERHIVVQEAEEPVVAFHQAQHLVGCRSETGIALHGAHECVGNPLADAFGRVARIADHEEQVAQVAVVLLGQSIQHFFEPRTGLMHHHHGHYGRGERSGGFHEDPRLAAAAPPHPVTRPQRTRMRATSDRCACKS